MPEHPDHRRAGCQTTTGSLTTPRSCSTRIAAEADAVTAMADRPTGGSREVRRLAHRGEVPQVRRHPAGRAERRLARWARADARLVGASRRRPAPRAGNATVGPRLRTLLVRAVAIAVVDVVRVGHVLRARLGRPRWVRGAVDLDLTQRATGRMSAGRRNT